MSDLNSVNLTGRLTADATKNEVNGKTKVDFCLCVNSYFNKSDYANYFYMSYWGELAEGIFPYLKKGQCVNVEAKLKQDRWEKDNQKFQKISFVVNNVQLQNTGKSSNTEKNIPFEPFTCDLPEE